MMLNLRNRIDQINQILLTQKPQFLVLNELQKHKNDKYSQHQFPGYKLEHDGLDKVDGFSRTGILIQNGINYKRRKDLEDHELATVWIQYGEHNKKHALLHALYRQFQRQGRKDSISHPNQRARWDKILTNWEKAMTEDREITTMGDTNIDALLWDTPPQNWSPYDRRKYPLYQMLKERILTMGNIKINQEYTRYEIQPLGRYSCLDQIFTTHPEKVNNHTTIHTTFSDHSMVILNKKTKKNQKN